MLRRRQGIGGIGRTGLDASPAGYRRLIFPFGTAIISSPHRMIFLHRGRGEALAMPAKVAAGAEDRFVPTRRFADMR